MKGKRCGTHVTSEVLRPAEDGVVHGELGLERRREPLDSSLVRLLPDPPVRIQRNMSTAARSPQPCRAPKAASHSRLADILVRKRDSERVKIALLDARGLLEQRRLLQVGRVGDERPDAPVLEREVARDGAALVQREAVVVEARRYGNWPNGCTARNAGDLCSSWA